jgi:tricarballylate dehydrogenase
VEISSDVVIAGGGNAALCAALTARECGVSVTVLECAPPEFRGGNSRHTRNMRCMHDAPTDVLTGSYTEEEYFADVLRVTGGQTDEPLARLVIRESPNAAAWARSYGVRFQPSLGGTLHLGRTNAFFLGGGKALMNTYYEAAARQGVRVIYNAEVTGLNIGKSRDNSRDRGRFLSGEALVEGMPAAFTAKSFIAASGGFEANLDWLKEAWGEAAENFIVRGTPYNKGKVLKLLLDCGAEPVGDPKQCHAVAIDGRAPKFDGGIVTRLDCVPLGIVVNRDGPSATRSGDVWWPSSRDRSPIRSSIRRCSAGSCRRSFQQLVLLPSPSWPRCWICRLKNSRRRSRRSIAPCSPAISITISWTIAIPMDSFRASHTGRRRSIRRHSWVILCAPESRSPTSA